VMASVTGTGPSTIHESLHGDLALGQREGGDALIGGRFGLAGRIGSRREQHGDALVAAGTDPLVVAEKVAEYDEPVANAGTGVPRPSWGHEPAVNSG